MSFIDAEDGSDPDDIEKQKIYMISYLNLINNISDLHGRIKPDSSANIGYAYYGNFRKICVENVNENREKFICPITQVSIIRPWILLEDGFTYEKHAITRWLSENPLKSPFLGNLTSATLLPNYALTRTLICPITLEPFKEPYYCVEDGYTYEKAAIIEYVEKETKGKDGSSSITIKSPGSGKELQKLSLYPNKALFDERSIPHNQEPIILLG